MLVYSRCNIKTFVFSLVVLVLGATFLLGLFNQELKTLQKLADVSNTCHNVTKQYVKECEVQNVSNSNKKCCFYVSWKHQSLAQLAILAVEEKSRLNNCMIAELGTKREKIKNAVYQLGNRPNLCRRFVTLGHYLGRMGNQMFQIASLLGTAYTNDVIPIIPNFIPIKRYFTLPNMINLKLNKMDSVVNCVVRKSVAFYNCTKEFRVNRNVVLHGYLQSWKYFERAKEVIKAVFKSKSKYLLNAKAFLSNISVTGFQRVCIHIRRGDMTTKDNVAYGYTVPGLDFIEKAKQFYINKYSRVQFLVASNDKTWCRKYLKDVYISPFTDPGDDMALMTLSDHVVVISGTFGWWGAWLSGGTTVYFNRYTRPGSPLASLTVNEDYYPPNWIGMS